MSDFAMIGRIVTHTAAPRFRVVFAPREDGSGAWDLGDIEWLDGPPPVPNGPRQATAAAKFLARLMREAGEHFAAHWRDDWIQAAVIQQAEGMGLSAYAIAKATGWAVSEDHVRDFLTRRKSMGSHKLQHVLSVLGVRLEGAE